MANTNEKDAFRFLNQHWDGVTFCSFEDVARLGAALGDPQNAVPAIHVAGTNGKGSVCAMLSSILICAGRRVGQFASPHLSSPEERCLLQGRPVALADFERAAEEVRRVAAELSIPLSFFVASAFASFLLFAESDLEYVVIETGLGGRLDATNTIGNPVATVITSIAFDHTHILGETIEAITGEKVGIGKRGAPMFVGDVPAAAREVISRASEEGGFPVSFVRDSVSGGWPDTSLPERIGLAGAHQRENASLACSVARHLGIDEPSIQKGLVDVRWPGRLETVEVSASDGGSRRFLFDVAHNADGVDSLCDFIEKEESKVSELLVILSILDRKPWQEMIQRLQTLVSSIGSGGTCRHTFIFTDSSHGSAVPPTEMQSFAKEGIVVESCEEAIRIAMDRSSEQSLIVVSGSIFLVGKVRPYVMKNEFSTIVC